MWLLPILHLVSRLVSKVYYRMVVSGGCVPATGPVLLVANHPNSLLDPVLVVTGAGRPVRFLAKAPLFSDTKVGFLVRGAGSIPVYRMEDDPGKMTQNRDMFRAVHDALEGGAAVGIFPEGISHSFPSMAELKTGAARIALGAAKGIGGAFPLVPFGLVPERKAQFRSQMLVVVGEPVAWNDLAMRGAGDREAVRDLTARIADALRHVTLNLERWEDQPVVEAAESIWSEWAGADSDPAARVARLEVTTRILSKVRASSDPEDDRLHGDLARHINRLDQLGLGVGDLGVEAHLRARWLWVLRRVYLLGTITLIPFLFTIIIFFVPFWVTDILTRLTHQNEDRIATYKLLIGVLVYGSWTLALSGWIGWSFGGLWGAALLLLAPPIGVFGNSVRERWRGAGREALRFRRLWHLRKWLDELRAEQEGLAVRLEKTFRRHEDGESLTPFESPS
jgi:glycerol-3-phosphate O-acyltransferase / dihydroxyacetone phosphate acyltransferase